MIYPNPLYMRNKYNRRILHILHMKVIIEKHRAGKTRNERN